ncbi:U32 family peptidase [bacterium]|nr:U32 family peptidase [bacterium]
MKRRMELFAPGGDIDAIKAAILAGADAIYCGLSKFNARTRAVNISLDDLPGILRLAHHHECKIFITLNIIILESEISAIINLLNKLANTTVDGVIVQDLGLLYLLNRYYKSFNLHASTQMTTHNRGQIAFLSKFDVSRVNLSRELNIHEIKELSLVAHQNRILTEVFVHGSYCISFSGLCYFSSVHGGNSGNRGQCSQPCRNQYVRTAEGKDYPLNLKDNSAYFDLKELYEAGVYSLKIEGRIKKATFVYTVVDAWRKNIQALYSQQKERPDSGALYKVFNRDFSNTFLKGDINKEMFIDNPRDHTIQHLSDSMPFATPEQLEKAHLALYAEKEAMTRSVEEKIGELHTEKVALSIQLTGECGEPLNVSVKSVDYSFNVLSETPLVRKGREALNREMVLKRFKTINETAYYIDELNMNHLDTDLFIPFKELTSLKKRLLFILNGSKENVDPIRLPRLKKSEAMTEQTKLSILISSKDDISLLDENAGDIYFQLPNSFQNRLDEYIDLFLENKKLIPWFPAVIIGENYNLAVKFLSTLNPPKIISNNTGIGYEASKRGIEWIAGPYMNISNSYSVLCLKENLHCKGAFLSNELHRNQIRHINCPEDFELHFSIYHPIVLMTSRQCLFHQVTGCEKNRVDATCIQNCEKESTITTMKKENFFIEKSRGNYHNIYSAKNYLNTAIVRDMPHTFSRFLIDLRNIETETDINVDKSKLIQYFKTYIKRESEPEEILHKLIQQTTCVQYKKGIY